MEQAFSRFMVRAFAPVVLGASVSVYGQDDLQQRLASQFTLTQVAADRLTITTAGTQVTLRKPGLMAYSVAAGCPYQNEYNKKGKISQPFGLNLACAIVGEGKKTYPTRLFHGGENFWVLAYFMKKDGVVLRLYSDADIHYYADLKFPLEKGSTANADEVFARIGEALAWQALPAATAPTAPADTAPPPAPGTEPAHIEMGQSIEQVIAIIGQPERTATAGNKQIYFYKDLKVTFVDGKVSDVQ